MCLVHDHGEPPPGQLADLTRDHRKLLQCGDDDRLSRLQGVTQFARGGIDVLHHAERLLELTHGGLQLTIEHAPVGDHHDGIEHAMIEGVVQRGQLMGQPADGEALAAARRVLHEIAVAGAAGARVGDEAAYTLQLMPPWEHRVAHTRFPAVGVFLLDVLHIAAHELQHRVARPGVFPQIGGGEARARGWHRWVAGTAKAPLVEREEACARPLETRGDEHQFRIHGKVRETAPVAEQRITRIAFGWVLVLADGVVDGLPVERVLELGGEERDAVEKEHQIGDTRFRLLRVAQLSHDAELIGFEQPSRVGIEAARRAEPGQMELAPGVLHPLPHHVERAAPFDFGRHTAQESLIGCRAVMLLKRGPRFGLGGQHEVEQVTRQQTELLVVVGGGALVVASRRRIAVAR